MKVLQINNFHYLFGGGERYYFELSKLLSKYNNHVAFFSMTDKKNKITSWSKYFVSHISLENIRLASGFKIFKRMIYSLESKDKIKYLLNDFHPQIAHVHNLNIFISPSIIPEIHKRNIPLVHTLHNYYMLAPTRGSLFHNNKICEISKRHNFYKSIFHKCIKNSYLLSTAFVIAQYMHYFLRYYRLIDLFIAPSIFIKNKFIEYGFDPKKIIHLPHFINYGSYKFSENSLNNNYILYFGRLSSEKGVALLLKVMKQLPSIKLKIVGSGSEYNFLLSQINTLNLKNIELVNFQDKEKLKQLIYNSRFSVIPSLWYENFSYSILESFATGKPVIGSRIGGIPELIKDGFNGFMFEPGNVAECAEKINDLWHNLSLCKKLGKNARENIEKKYGPEIHYEKIMVLYKKLINKYE